MKNLTLILAIILLVACQSEKKENETSGSLLVTGYISNPVDSFVYIMDVENGEIDSLQLNEGKCNKQIMLKYAGAYTMRHGRETAELFLEPGKDLEFSLDAKDFDETLKFKGAGAAPNEVIVGMYLMGENMQSKYGSIQDIYKNEPVRFLQICDSMKSAKENFLTENFEGKELNENFKMEQNANVLYGWANDCLIYKSYHAYFTGLKDFELPADFHAGIDELDLNNVALLNNPKFNQFVMNFADMKGETLSKTEPYKNVKSAQLFATLDFLNEKVLNSEIRNKVMTEIVSSEVQYGSLNGIEEAVAHYKELCTDKDAIAKIEENLNKWEDLMPGKVAPTFTYTSIDGEQVSLESLKGKMVYVDVWATWCGPCKREIPHLAQLEEKFHNDNIAFLSVSIDDEKESWVKMVTEDKLGGIQVFADGAWKSDIAKSYNIQGIPRFILIDENGNLIDAKADRPSGQIEKIIREHLNKNVLEA